MVSDWDWEGATHTISFFSFSFEVTSVLRSLISFDFETATTCRSLLETLRTFTVAAFAAISLSFSSRVVSKLAMLSFSFSYRSTHVFS